MSEWNENAYNNGYRDGMKAERERAKAAAVCTNINALHKTVITSLECTAAWLEAGLSAAEAAQELRLNVLKLSEAPEKR